MIKNILLISLTIILFNGCITKELPSYKIYALQLNSEKESFVPINRSIKILEPKTINSLNSTAITYVTSLEKNIYALSKWSDKPSKMLQELLTSNLSKHGFNFVTSSNLKTKTDYILQSELTHFEQKFINDNSFAILEIRVYLLDNIKNTTTFKTFMYKEKCSSNNALGAVKALNTLSNKLVLDINRWLITLK